MPPDDQDYGAEYRREEREQTTLNLLRAEIGERRTDRQEESRYRKGTLRWTFATFSVSLITMFAVIFYAYVARHQYDAMVAANQHAEQALQVQQRAYVHVQSVKLLRFEVGKMPEAIIEYKNTGLTPAQSVLVVPSSFIREPGVEPRTPKEAVDCTFFYRRPTGAVAPEPEPGIFRRIRIGRGQVLPPAVTRSVNTTWEFLGWDLMERPAGAEQFTGFVGHEPLTAEQFTEVRRWRKRWFVVLYISYFAQFDRCHASAEPFVYDPRDSSFHATGTGWRQEDDQPKAGSSHGGR